MMPWWSIRARAQSQIIHPKERVGLLRQIQPADCRAAQPKNGRNFITMQSMTGGYHNEVRT